MSAMRRRWGWVVLVLALACTNTAATSVDGAPTRSGGSASPAVSAPEAPPTRCSRSEVPRTNPTAPEIAVAYARGRWPIYVGLGAAGVVRFGDESRHHGWWYHKTLWAIAPDYDGPVTITGYQLDGPHRLMFNAAGPIEQQLDQLRFEPLATSASEKWRFGPSSTLIQAPGCYAFEVRRPGDVEYIPFIAAR
jgi:hypothetical protein